VETTEVLIEMVTSRKDLCARGTQIAVNPRPLTSGIGLARVEVKLQGVTSTESFVAFVAGESNWLGVAALLDGGHGWLHVIQGSCVGEGGYHSLRPLVQVGCGANQSGWPIDKLAVGIVFQERLMGQGRLPRDASTVPVGRECRSAAEQKKKAHPSAQGWAPMLSSIAQGGETRGVGIVPRSISALTSYPMSRMGSTMSPYIKEYHSSFDRSWDIVAMIGWGQGKVYVKMAGVRMLQWFIHWGWSQALCFERERDSGCAGQIAGAMYRNISSTC